MDLALKEFLKTNNKIGKYVLSMDCETSGTTLGPFDESVKQYQAVSFSFVIFEYESLKEVDCLHVIIKYDDKKYKWSTEAEKIHGLSKEFTKINGVDFDTACEIIVNFLIKWFDYNSHIHVTGHNVEFDIAFLTAILDKNGLMFKVGKKFDTSTTAGIVMGVTRSNELYDVLGFQTRAEHNSLEDARYNVKVWRALRSVFYNDSF